MKKLDTSKLTLIALALSATSFSALAADEANPSTSWQTPLAAEFSALDTTGNGLLLPNEASKGNAFNKKTFAQADVDRDGYIDQNEYIRFKTGQWPTDAQYVNQSITNQESGVNAPNSEPSAVPDDGLSISKQLGNPDVTSQAESLPGEQFKNKNLAEDDNIITHKVIATLFGSNDLETLSISVETNQGQVLLSGFVESQKDRLQAAYLTSTVEGVKSVINELEVMA